MNRFLKFNSAVVLSLGSALPGAGKLASKNSFCYADGEAESVVEKVNEVVDPVAKKMKEAADSSLIADKLKDDKILGLERDTFFKVLAGSSIAIAAITVGFILYKLRNVISFFVTLGNFFRKFF